MNTHSKTKYFFVILLLALAGFVYFSYTNKQQPYEVISPEGYDAGTTLSLYKNVPPSFPEEFVLSNTKVDYSGKIETPEGRTEMTVSLTSLQKLLDIINVYRSSLPAEGWTVSVKSATQQLGILEAVKGEKVVLVTVTPLNAIQRLITLQYEK